MTTFRAVLQATGGNNVGLASFNAETREPTGRGAGDEAEVGAGGRPGPLRLRCLLRA